MQPQHIVATFGPRLTGLNNSDLCELSVGFAGLRAVLHLGEDAQGDDRFVEIVFTAQRGFRCLDEGDLLPYWASGAFDTANYVVFEIKSGGWAEQETMNGMLNTTGAVGAYREWFIASSNACLNVISNVEPLVRLL